MSSQFIAGLFDWPENRQQLLFTLEILSILGKYADSSILGVFLESYQNIQTKVWFGFLPQITAMLQNS
jgi:hypothetical protein